MATNQLQRNSRFRKTQNIPQKTIGILLKIISLIITSCIFIILINGFILGLYINNHINDPMSYTPYPVANQPPEGLSFREFLVCVDGYYDSEYQDRNPKANNDKGLLYSFISEYIREDAFLINQILSAPIIINSVMVSSIATIYPESLISQIISEKDFSQTVYPLIEKDYSLANIKKVVFLQTQSHYWYVFNQEFSQFYQKTGCLINN